MKKPKSSLKLHLFSGFHDPGLSCQFRSSLLTALEDRTSLPLPRFDVTCYPVHLVPFPALEHNKLHLFIGFSVGVIKAAIAAYLAQSRGQAVAGLIAVDGWGVALWDRSFPVYRFSHDAFTHFTATLLGGTGVFFADPPVEHLTLWAQPHQVKGWHFLDSDEPTELSASAAFAETIQSLVQKSDGLENS